MIDKDTRATIRAFQRDTISLSRAASIEMMSSSSE
jgi:hypothetical protein